MSPVPQVMSISSACNPRTLPAIPHFLGEPFNDLLNQVALSIIAQQRADLVGEPGPIAYCIFGTKPALFNFGPSSLKNALSSGEDVGLVE
ncbi:hypothetical protein OIU35_15205 [Boseaceae bacterium BT-24-1]|nr:hypothetical protein [Boseaceae bacterium BT-24-1]